ncbi:transmembrane protein 242-like [Panonychus citri]|uniref:transmembrane protein 242-like n=1 Tax=Panonychus citri TaxID=50023 RepID=UPI0023077B74|nr:transmembrane protein 242-like [Panonychus citri]
MSEDPLKEQTIEQYIESLFESKNKDAKKSYFPEILFFSGVASMSLLAGFSSSLVLTKRKDPEAFQKGLQNVQAALHENGVSLASKALKRATIYSVSGATLISFVVYKFLLPKTLPAKS